MYDLCCNNIKNIPRYIQDPLILAYLAGGATNMGFPRYKRIGYWADKVTKFKQLFRSKLKRDLNYKKTCAVCQSDFVENDKIIVTRC